MQEKFITNNYNNLKEVLKTTNKTILLKIENNLEEKVYLPFIYFILKDLNKNTYNFISKKKIKTADTKNIEILLINNRINLLSRDARFNLIFKSFYSTFNKDITVAIKNSSLKNTFIDGTDDEFNVLLSKESFVTFNKKIQSIFILDEKSRFFSKEVMDQLIEKDLIKVFILKDIKSKDSIIFYDNINFEKDLTQ